MTLNTDEIARTRSELNANLALTGLTHAEVAADLDFTPERLHAALDSEGSSDPVDVWQLRDYLETAVKDSGRTPVPYTVLTADNRLKARTWFRLRTAPRHNFTTNQDPTTRV